MCGIAGAARLRGAPPSAERVATMSDRVRHRGPDGAGLWTAPSGLAVFGHRRLSVIDIASGAQPMTDPSGRFGITFNGEIYNYVELRKELEARGQQFRTASDTEVLLHLLIRDGARCLSQLVGMYAFAFWDDARESLLLARDRIGEKPLYFAEHNGCIHFASTFAALRATASATGTLDPAAVDAFLNLGYVPAPLTIDASIRKLEAGTFLTADTHGVRVERYWHPGSGIEPFEGSEDQAANQLDELLQTAVRLRLRSDVPLGFFLSGGIDSSLVSAIASRAVSEPIHTFSISFPNSPHDESPYAARVAELIGSEHHCFQVHDDLVGLLPEIVRLFGEPFGDSTALPIWLLARETRKHVTVVLTGDGGDEGFAGYNWYATALRLRRINRVITPYAARFGSRLLGRGANGSVRFGRLARGMGVLALGDADRFATLRALVSNSEAHELYAGELANVRPGGYAPSTSDLASKYDGASGSALSRMRHVDIQTYLADCMLPKVDVATMAHALEARPPLLDPDLLQFALSLPDHLLIRRNVRKWVLRAVLERYLPLGLFDRPKQGFTVPISQWFRGSLQRDVARLASSTSLLDSGWFSREGISRVVSQHMAGQRDHGERLYNLLVLDEWLRQN